MFELGIVKRNITRADRTAADALGRYGSATVYEALGRVGLLEPYMRPIFPALIDDGEVGGLPVGVEGGKTP